MLRTLLNISCACLVLAVAQAGVSRATAVELPPLPDLDPASGPISVGGGWYLRGDAGVGSMRSGRWTPPLAGSLAPVDPAIARERIADGWSVAAGAGYRFGTMLRADLTAEWRAPATAKAVSGGAVYRGDFGARLVLANAYVDLFTWEGLTPFVGAGIGLARNELSNVVRNPLPGVAGEGEPDVLARGRRTGLAWALTAGLAYDLAPGLKVELAYRYLDLGKAETGAGLCGSAYGCATGLRGKAFASHDIRLGLRWEIGTP